MNSWILLLILFLSIPSSLPIENTQSLNQTASEEAKPHFDKGLLLLHNFEYDDAAEEFIIAQQKDPDFTMAYWGESMTYNHPLWGELEVEKSRIALKKFGNDPAERLAKAKNELEKDLMQAVNILFGTASKPDRDKAYAEHMGAMLKKYPDNNDVACFYALSLLALKKSMLEWEDYNLKAAELMNYVLKKDPNHPGALHYLIHADDHPKHASDGFDAARKYSKAASYSDHALHMPSHIYLALGMWDDVVQSNEISWKASLDRKERKHLDNDKLAYHTHMWLMYAYLQLGKFQHAKELVKNEKKLVDELPSPNGRFHLFEMKAHYLLTTNEWNSKIADLQIKTDDLRATFHFVSLYLDGYKSFQQAKPVKLARLIEQFEKDLVKATRLQKANDGITVCGVNFFAGTPTERDITVGNRLLNRLKGIQAWLAKDVAKAESFLKENLLKEGAGLPGVPIIPIVSNELYGEFLLANNRPAEALQQFNKSLDAAPNRYNALKGKLMAARNLKDVKTEAEVKKQMMEILKDADHAATKNLW